MPFLNAKGYKGPYISPFGKTLVDDASNVVARATLGLGSLAVINSPLPIINGGSGQVTQQTAIDALTNVAAATNEHVLTKDTATGNVIFKATAVALPVVDETAIVYKTGNVAITQTHDINAYTVARVVSWPDAAMTVAGQNYANVFTANQTVNGAGGVALTVRAAAAQNVMAWQDSGGTTRSFLDSTAYLWRFGDSVNRGSVGLGGATPIGTIAIGVDRNVNNTTTSVYGFNGEIAVSGSVAAGLSLAALSFGPKAAHTSGTLANLIGVDILCRNTAVGAITNGYGQRIQSIINTGGGSINTVYGLNIANQTAGVTNYAIYTNMGTCYFGDKTIITQPSLTGAAPTLKLTQVDLSEEFIRFEATIGAGNPIDTAALGAYYGKVRVYIEGVGAKWLALYD